MGSRQILPHLLSMPQWWDLSDSNGRTPLMRALATQGFSPVMLTDLIQSNPAIEKSLRRLDHGGKNIWWHLLYHYGYRSRKGQDWLAVLRDRVPLQPSATSGRGLFIDHVLVSPTRQWHEFFPKEGFGRMVYELPGNAHATWWGCSEDDASEVVRWLLTVRNPSFSNMRSMASNLGRMRQVDPMGRSNLPMPLRGTLMLIEALYTSNPDGVRAEMDAGVGVMLSPKAQARLEKEASGRGVHFRNEFQMVMRHNNTAALDLSTARTGRTRPTRRL